MLLCAAFVVFFRFQSVFFPNQTSSSVDADPPNLANLQIKIPEVSYSEVAAAALWGMKEKLTTVADSDIFTSSSWDIKRDKDGWTLRSRESPEEIWAFNGVILLNTQRASVFFCQKCENRWRLVKEGGRFFDLFVRSVNSSTVIVEDNNGEQWGLEQFIVEIPTLEKQ